MATVRLRAERKERESSHGDATGVHVRHRHREQLISEWCEVLPTERICLRVPVVLPHEYDEDWAVRNREDAEVRRHITEEAPTDADVLKSPPLPTAPRVYPT